MLLENTQAAQAFRVVADSEENHAMGHLEFLQVIFPPRM